ncbi:DUF600 family protein [Fictibacillus sp. 5RED26]|uniref:immunity protein YezG family protein n=1 Tax=Fictibacillus sp. 5RED26 TaxID=2745876 RepID=UPI0018CE2B41|nr:immunity protein YezG family protein [Fictibacillus sp. 5RED26]MBH0156672.1 DUF600 family protein [Fictibacillus sp. 5RED26]
MESKIMEQTYQQIANTLLNIIQEDWKQVLLYAEIREGYKKVYFYYYPEYGGSPIYSLDIVEIYNMVESEYDRLENELYQNISRLHEEFLEQGQEKWTNLTYILENTGKMNINYGYDDLSQLSPVEKQEKWESEYLTYDTGF